MRSLPSWPWTAVQEPQSSQPSDPWGNNPERPLFPRFGRRSTMAV
jgi:hypothetical protein